MQTTHVINLFFYSLYMENLITLLTHYHVNAFLSSCLSDYIAPHTSMSHLSSKLSDHMNLPSKTSYQINFHNLDSKTFHKHTQFLTYCSIKGIPKCDILPTSESFLCEFAASLAGKIAGKTVRAKCNGIQAWHIQNNFLYHSRVTLDYVIKGIEINIHPLLERKNGCLLQSICYLCFNLALTLQTPLMPVFISLQWHVSGHKYD